MSRPMDFAVGDVAVVRHSGSYGVSRHLARVDRLTKTQVIVDTGSKGAPCLRRFHRDDLSEVGEGVSGRWITLEIATPELVEQVKEERTRRLALKAVTDMKVSKLTTDQLVRIVAILNEVAA